VLCDGKNQIDALVYIVVIKGEHDDVVFGVECAVLNLNSFIENLMDSILFGHDVTSFAVFLSVYNRIEKM